MIRAWRGRAYVLGIGLGLAMVASACGGGGSAPPPPTVSVTISPTLATVAVGATQQFTASVTGTANTVVTWSVGGVTGGNSTVGTILTSGLYTAPSTVPAPSNVTVSATSQAEPTKSASATVTVVGQPLTQREVTVTAGMETRGIDVQVSALTPTLSLIAVGTCTATNCTAGSVGVQVAQGRSETLFLVGKGIVPGTVYAISGKSTDVVVTQPSESDFATTTTGEPAVSVAISVSPTAELGPRNIMVTNSAGELVVFVGGLLITQGP